MEERQIEVYLRWLRFLSVKEEIKLFALETFMKSDKKEHNQH